METSHLLPERSQDHMTEELRSPLDHTDPSSLPLSWHELYSLRVLINLHSSIRLPSALCSSNRHRNATTHIHTTSLVYSSVLCLPQPYYIFPVFPRVAQLSIFPTILNKPKRLFLSLVCSLAGRVKGNWYWRIHSVLWASRRDLGSLILFHSFPI
jgi:hypothetical protein